MTLPLSFSGIKSPLKKELAFLTVPIFIETLLIMSLGAIDTFMLSRHSDESVAAVGMANQIITFCFLIFEVINLGTSVLCSQYLGAGLRERMEKLVAVSLVTNLIFGIAVSAFLFFYPRQILVAMGLSGKMLGYGEGYMRIVGGFAFVQALGMTLSAVLRSNNKAYWPMLVILVVNIMNIIGNYALIFGKFGFPELGVNGAAVSTAVSRIVSMTALFIIVYTTTIKCFPLDIFVRFLGVGEADFDDIPEHRVSGKDAVEQIYKETLRDILTSEYEFETRVENRVYDLCPVHDFITIYRPQI